MWFGCSASFGVPGTRTLLATPTNSGWWQLHRTTVNDQKLHERQQRKELSQPAQSLRHLGSRMPELKGVNLVLPTSAASSLGCTGPAAAAPLAAAAGGALRRDEGEMVMRQRAPLLLLCLHHQRASAEGEAVHLHHRFVGRHPARYCDVGVRTADTNSPLKQVQRDRRGAQASNTRPTELFSCGPSTFSAGHGQISQQGSKPPHLFTK